QRRTIAWKKDKPLHPENLFFRTIDTGRLLPMALATFRVQLYVTEDLCDAFPRDEEKEKWSTYVVLALMHRILIFRNIHDYGGDISIIFINWNKEFVDMATDYWVDSSANKWIKEEREYRSDRILVCEISRTSHGLKPSFYELDLCVRALLLDENVGYVPPFIILFEMGKDGKARALFTDLSHIPSPWVLDSLPKTCGSTPCTYSECIGLWHTEEPRSFHHPSPMVRDVKRPDDRIMTLQRCQKCKEVLYCSREHQARSLVSPCPLRQSWTVCSSWIWISINVFARFLLNLGESVLRRCAHSNIYCGIG
ncbi:hypothetical protein ARMGADRAFT_948046, partial [Armillaria gallica]